MDVIARHVRFSRVVAISSFARNIFFYEMDQLAAIARKIVALAWLVPLFLGEHTLNRGDIELPDQVSKP